MLKIVRYFYKNWVLGSGLFQITRFAGFVVTIRVLLEVHLGVGGGLGGHLPGSSHLCPHLQACWSGVAVLLVLLLVLGLVLGGGHVLGVHLVLVLNQEN